MADKIIYLRMLVYTLTIGMHVSNIAYIAVTIGQKYVDVNDPKILNLKGLQARFLTCWTFFLHIVHAFAGLTCDYLTLKNSGDRNYRLPKYLRGFRNTLFSTVVWPSTWVVSLIFWSLYHYDRSLVYPDFADILLTSTSNHIMHTLTVPTAILEILLQPRSEPKSHLRNLGLVLFYFAFYFIVLTYTYIERKIWIYGFFEICYGKIYYPVLPLGIFFLAVLIYYVQWPLTSFIWSKTLKEKKQR